MGLKRELVGDDLQKNPEEDVSPPSESGEHTRKRARLSNDANLNGSHTPANKPLPSTEGSRSTTTFASPLANSNNHSSVHLSPKEPGPLNEGGLDFTDRTRPSLSIEDVAAEVANVRKDVLEQHRTQRQTLALIVVVLHKLCE